MEVSSLQRSRLASVGEFPERVVPLTEVFIACTAIAVLQKKVVWNARLFDWYLCVDRWVNQFTRARGSPMTGAQLKTLNWKSLD